MYTVNSTYKVIHNMRYPGLVDISFQKIWKLKIPPKAVKLMWRLIHNALPTIDNLQRRGLGLDSDDSHCVLCNEHPETESHLFLSFPQHFLQYAHLCYNQEEREKWDTIRSAITWCIWQARNNKVFRGKNIVVEELENNITFTSWSWLRLNKKSFSFHYDLW
uniref:Reverse transcriptase zinc-binding domain-containing protein n=1 Tax=Cajanus cajan TaxID=3821 RepID=A0A151T657_CAJCA|nr:hypothetical protein KK1_017040 [Cajanus cajan]